MTAPRRQPVRLAAAKITRLNPAPKQGVFEASNWWYDPVAASWHLPDDPEVWPATERLLDELNAYDIERLAEPLD